MRDRAYATIQVFFISIYSSYRYIFVHISRYQIGDDHDKINYHSYGYYYITLFHEISTLRRVILFYRAIILIEDTFNVMLLILFLYFGIFLTSYGFLILNVSKARGTDAHEQMYMYGRVKKLSFHYGN